MTSTRNLTGVQLEYIVKFLPVVKTTKLRKWKYTQILSGIIYVLNTSCQWHLLPDSFPPYKTVYHYFRKWKLDRTWDKLNYELNKKVRKKMKKHMIPGCLIIDSQSVDSSHSGRKKLLGYDGHKRVKGVKRFILTDTQGLIWASLTLPANTAEIKGARLLMLLIEYLLQTKTGLAKYVRLIVADKGFVSKEFGDYLKQKYNIIFQVKPKKLYTKVKLPEEVYRQTLREYIDSKIAETKRWIVERSFSWLDKCRRLMSFYETKLRTSDAFIKLAMIRLNVKKLVKEN